MTEAARDIHIAIQTHALNDIEHFLKSCTSKTINCKDTEGSTPLHLAAAQGMSSVVESLLKKKAKVEIKDNMGWTPLHCASNFHNYEIAEKLIEAKANIHAVTNDKNTVLSYLVKGDCDSSLRIKLIEKILPKGVNKENIHKETPFTRACGSSSCEVIKILLSHSANVNQQTLVF